MTGKFRRHINCVKFSGSAGQNKQGHINGFHRFTLLGIELIEEVRLLRHFPAISGRDVAVLRLYVECIVIAVLALVSAAPVAFAPPVWAAADDQPPPDLSPAMLEQRSHRLPLAELGATLSRLACAGTSGRAAPPC